MKKIETNLKDCYILEPDKFGDDRGYYSPFFAEKDYVENGLHSIKGIVQGARSKSGKGIVRGLHFQKDPYCQSKIVECLNGAVLDVVVDLRKDSPTYMKWTSVELTPENGRQLLIPRGFAHGFVSLKDNSLFQYLVDNDYKPSHEDGVLWCDPKINVDWNLKKYGIENPLLSEKDKNRLPLSDNTPDFYTKKRYLVTGASGQLGYDVIKELNKRGINKIDGIVFDLGVSSPQLDIPERGFSYHNDAKLDMRMDRENSFSAYDVVNNYDISKLTEIFNKYGESKFSRNIAKKIVEYRKNKNIETTLELVEIIKTAVPMKFRVDKHPARQIFQAIRIEVNHELDVIEPALEDALSLLNVGGRVSVITFHSLEDKIVKKYFKRKCEIDSKVKGLPNIPEEYLPDFKLVISKAITPSDAELKNNNRARSAKLRVIERIK